MKDIKVSQEPALSNQLSINRYGQLMIRENPRNLKNPRRAFIFSSLMLIIAVNALVILLTHRMIFEAFYPSHWAAYQFIVAIIFGISSSLGILLYVMLRIFQARIELKRILVAFDEA